ncbi:hypothetical protein D1871_21070 [Nakamurella silvestris]|nr:hypothetical protein D1871_21070 [Nakamurella silvestris]
MTVLDTDPGIDAVPTALQALKAGRCVVLVDESTDRPAEVLAVVGGDGGRAWELLSRIGDGTLRTVGEVATDPKGVWTAGHAAATLLQVAGVPFAAALTSLPENGLPRWERARETARELGTSVLTVQQIAQHSLSGTIAFESSGPARLPTRFGDFDAHCYRFAGDEAEHLVLTSGSPWSVDTPVRIAVHRECRNGDVFGDLLCRCRRHLEESLTSIAAPVSGVVVYLRQSGLTVFEMATRVYTILGDLGIRRARFGESGSAADEPSVLAVLAALNALHHEDIHGTPGGVGF